MRRIIISISAHIINFSSAFIPFASGTVLVIYYVHFYCLYCPYNAVSIIYTSIIRIVFFFFFFLNNPPPPKFSPFPHPPPFPIPSREIGICTQKQQKRRRAGPPNLPAMK